MLTCGTCTLHHAAVHHARMSALELVRRRAIAVMPTASAVHRRIDARRRPSDSEPCSQSSSTQSKPANAEHLDDLRRRKHHQSSRAPARRRSFSFQLDRSGFTPFAQADVKRALAAVADRGALEADDEAAEFRQPQPERHHALEHAAAAAVVAAARALAGDDQHHLAAARLLRPQEAKQRVVRLGLRHAVQIEPAVDRMRAARDALLRLAGRAAPAAAARRASAAAAGLRASAQVWRAALRAVRRGRQLASSVSVRATLPQRRDRTGDALPQDALVVAQPPPAHVCRVVPGRLFRAWSRLGLGLGVWLRFPPWRPACASWRLFVSAAFSAFFSGVFSAGLGALRRRPLPWRQACAASARLGLGFALTSLRLGLRLGRLRLGLGRSAWPPPSRHSAICLESSAAAVAAESRRRRRAGSSSFGTSMTKRPSWRSRPATLRGLVAGAEIEIGARRPDDRAAGVLRDHQPAEPGVRLQALDRQIGRDEERRAVGVQLAIDRDRAARRQRDALRADRLLVGGQMRSRGRTRRTCSAAAAPRPPWDCAPSIRGCGPSTFRPWR